jgi:hypothetical protein
MVLKSKLVIRDADREMRNREKKVVLFFYPIA